MGEAINKVKEHFNNYKTRKIIVPEWDNLEIFVEPITLEQKKKILDKTKKDEVEALVYALIWLAKDGEGNPHFTLEDKYASQIMYFSFAYLPIIFTFYCFDLL